MLIIARTNGVLYFCLSAITQYMSHKNLFSAYSIDLIRAREQKICFFVVCWRSEKNTRKNITIRVQEQIFFLDTTNILCHNCLLMWTKKHAKILQFMSISFMSTNILFSFFAQNSYLYTYKHFLNYLINKFVNKCAWTSACMK